LPGFLIYLVYSAQKTGDWKRAAIPLAYVAESMLVGVFILVPLIYTQALPRQWLTSGNLIPSPPSPPPARPAGHPAPPSHHPTVDAFTAPPMIPTTIASIVDAPEPPQGQAGPVGPFVPGAVSGFGGGGNSILDSMPWGKEPPPPPPMAP